MVRIPIADLDDPRIAIYRSLKATNHTRGLDRIVVGGRSWLSGCSNPCLRRPRSR